VSQVPVVSAHDPQTIAGSLTERGLLRRSVEDPSLLGAEIIDLLEPPFHAVPADDPVREAVELLSGQTEALLVTVDGRPAGIVTRADLVESMAR
jgi:cystathionine beta-synthase